MGEKLSAKKLLTYILIVIIIVAFGGGSFFIYYQNRASSSNAVASVNGNEIFYTRDSKLVRIYSYYLDQYKKRFPNLTAEMQKQIFNMALNEVINEEILIQNARKQGIIVSPFKVYEALKDSQIFYDETGNFMYPKLPEDKKIYYYNLFEDQLITKLMISDIDFAANYFTDYEVMKNYKIQNTFYKIKLVYFSINDVDENELKEFYNQHKDEYKMMEAAHILVKDEGLANTIYKQLQKNPELFVEFVAKYSIDKATKKVGGYLGKFDKNKMVKEFTRVAFNMKKANEISKPVKTTFGYHIIKCIKPPYYPEFSEIKDKIKEKYIMVNDAKLKETKKNEAYVFYDKIHNMDGNFDKAAKKLNLNIMITKEFNYRGYIFDEINKKYLTELYNVDEFFNNLIKMKLQDISKPFKVSDGYVVYKLIEIKKPDMDKYKKEIDKEKKEYRDLMQNIFEGDFNKYLKNNSKIKYFLKNH